MTATTPAVAREPWPEIDRLAADADVILPDTLGWYAGVKVLLDYAATLVLLIPAVPLILLAAAAVRVSSRGPVFYTQTRLGLNGRRYKIIKIRTMHHNVELRSGIQWSRKHDSRVFWVGRVLRATHLDELPQLFNVLLGHMSLVGPRPERPVFIDKFRKTIPNYMARHAVKCGITGWAQVHGWRGNTSLRKRIQFDLYYITHWSFWLDLRILWLTVTRALFDRNAY